MTCQSNPHPQSTALLGRDGANLQYEALRRANGGLLQGLVDCPDFGPGTLDIDVSKDRKEVIKRMREFQWCTTSTNVIKKAQ